MNDSAVTIASGVVPAKAGKVSRKAAVVEWLAGTFEHWARAGVDGFRLDAAADLPFSVVRRIAEAVRAVREDCVLFGEVVPDNGWRFLDAGLHAVTDFPMREALVDLLVRRTIDAERYGQLVRRRRFYRGGPGHAAIAFTSTHDQPRLATLAGDARVARLGQLLVLLGPEVPAMVYGDEIGLASDHADRGFEGAWPDRMPMDWEARDEVTLATVRSAIALRRAHPALARGTAQHLDLDGAGRPSRRFALRRALGEQVIDVLVHAGEGTVEVALPAGPAAARVLLACGEAELGEGTARLGPYAALVLERRPRVEIVELLTQLAGSAAELAEEAFVAGMTEVPALPPRLYVTVTEQCNLRCVHCITRAGAHARGPRAHDHPGGDRGARRAGGAARGLRRRRDRLVRPSPTTCSCDDPGVAAFRAADDFANRSHFRPCRALFEQAVVDPDGTVRPVDYEEPAIGNLGERPLLEIWNGEEMKRARRFALARRGAEQRARCVAETRSARG